MNRPSRSSKKNASSVEGFISNTGSVDPRKKTLKRRFNQHYRPHPHGSRRASGHSTSEEKKDLNTIADQHQEGFTARTFAISDESVSSGVRRAQTVHRAQDLDDDTLFDVPLKADPPKRKGIFGRRKKRSIRKRVFRSAAVLMIAFIVAVSSVFGYAYIKGNQIFKGNGEGAAALSDNVDPSLLNGEGDGRINILVLGKGGPGHEAPDLTDTLLLASIDPVQNEAALLSVPRDLYVSDSNGYSTKINAVYANAKQASYAAGNEDDQVAEDAGLAAIKQSVSDVVGLPIHYYVMVNFKAFEDAIDIVGGLDIFIEEPLYDASVAWLLGGNPLIADSGWQTLDGQRALLYARSRKGSARGDFDRTQRQREIIVALQQEVLSAGTFANPVKIISLFETFGDNVRTDLNGLSEVQRLYEIGSEIGPSNITSVGLADDPILVTTGFQDNQSVVLPIAGFGEYAEIRSFIRNTIRDGFLSKENSRVVILNGTGIPGLATARQEELNSFGYNVISVDNAPTSDYVQTRLISLNPAEHPYTDSYLTRRLGISSENVTIEGLPTADTADFVIILGTNEAN